MFTLPGLEVNKTVYISVLRVKKSKVKMFQGKIIIINVLNIKHQQTLFRQFMYYYIVMYIVGSLSDQLYSLSVLLKLFRLFVML